MAEIQIVMKQEIRPCILLDRGMPTCKALWHMFYLGEALVELESGDTIWVSAHDIKFLDSKEKFEDYDWKEGL